MGVNLKEMAAEAAMDWVKPGMKLGLGTGSTANELVYLLGAAVADGLDIVCVPTSEATAKLAKEYNIPLTTLDETPKLNLTIDGADEIGPDLMLVKGGGGAHLREKIVACASDYMLVIADDSKLVDTLGAFPIPLEVVPFGLQATKEGLEAAFQAEGLNGELVLRERDGERVVTDSGNFIFDAKMGLIKNPASLVARLTNVPGLVEHGFFLDIAQAAVVSSNDGVKVLRR
ncbi:MAG: ribose-5-phosphate isomerase RpiA [Hyphomicrobiales bacterium]